MIRNPAHVAFAVLTVVWGSNFIFMKAAAETITPGQVTVLRVLFGLVPVVAYAVSRRALSRSHLRYAHHFFVMSVLTTSLHYFLFASGTSLLESGVAGALSGSIPLFSLIAAAAFLRDERVTVRRALGVLVGLGGVVLVARPWEAGGVSTAGVVYMLLGSALFGLSFVYAKRFLAGLDIAPESLTTYQMALGLITLLALTDVSGITAIGGDAGTLAGVLVLGLLGTGFAYVLYYFVVERLGAIAASSSTYVPPVVALAIGWLLVDEALRPSDGLGVLLILGGVVVCGQAATGSRRRSNSSRQRSGSASPGTVMEIRVATSP